jgi:hypothetical protein
VACCPSASRLYEHTRTKHLSLISLCFSK